MKNQHRWWFASACLSAALLLVACGGGGAEPTQETTEPAETAVQEGEAEEPTTASGKTTLGLWTHSAGNPDELAVIEQWVADYNAQSDKYEVVIESFPQASYNDSVAAASVAGSLPCIIDLDAPTVPNFAWSGYIQPLPITEAEIDEMGVLDNDVGRYNGQIYSLGQFDVALLVYARQSILDEYGIRAPTIEEPWTLDEFMAALDTLKESGEFEYPFDVNAGYTGEWWPYAYSPMLQSFGGDLINRDNYLEAESVLNGPEAVAWAEWFQSLFTEGYAPATPADDQGFLQGRIPLWYTGSWAARSVLDQYGDDALFLPPPDFGNGPVIGAGSWQMGVSTNCSEEASEGAFEFVFFTMTPENIALMSETSSLIPTTEVAANMTELYGEGGSFRIFFDMAEAFALVRPETPGYLTISSQFEQAGLSIRDGGNVQDALDDAVDAVERDIEDNGGYGFQE
ncbi:MAG: extracellular solute-binding protein [Chloroflexi bacterium]|nr:extracellular solute-binding protein [Chloroflexota bacterium]MCI0575754.1 extracellular solute-binding protein [Chloroflexota bacterium]MCI0643639.1 extracellular solute-binding protein [Chloroflexota bacterium]MCI0729820.1 extracellular solute-binding protein [Chloroflexota bacterium]